MCQRCGTGGRTGEWRHERARDADHQAQGARIMLTSQQFGRVVVALLVGAWVYVGLL